MCGNAMADLFATAENEAFSSVSRGMADLRKHMADMTASVGPASEKMRLDWYR